MISPTTFRDLVSGRRRGIAAAAARSALAVASVPYAWAVTRRNRRYDRGTAVVTRAGVPVISVGNLTVGGTGKTPMVEWIVRRLCEREVRPVILSRGYGAAAGSLNDEAMELELALPGVRHLQNPDRAAAARAAVQQFEAEALVLDDGFQHRRLARDLEIVLLDACEPFGFDRLLPRGTLREQVAGLARAHVIVLSRANILDASAREAIRRRATRYCPDAVWCEVVHRPVALVDAKGVRTTVEALRGARVGAFCGIGNPAGFRHTLAGLECDVAAWREFPDHHAYSESDAGELAAMAAAAEASQVVCTRKDLVKLPPRAFGATALRAVEVGLAFLAGERELNAAIARAIEAPA